MCLQIAYNCLMESDFPHLLTLLPLSLVVVAVGYFLIVTKQAKEKTEKRGIIDPPEFLPEVTASFVFKYCYGIILATMEC